MQTVVQTCIIKKMHLAWWNVQMQRLNDRHMCIVYSTHKWNASNSKSD